MAAKLAVLAGLKAVDPSQYHGWDGTNGCVGCERDVDNMYSILNSEQFEITALKTSQATSANILSNISNAATKLQEGDIFVFYFSGHGGQQPADPGGDLEQDGKDETLITYDRRIVDDELNEKWLSFKPGVRLVMISDSCNSGTNYKAILDIPTAFASPIRVFPPDPQAKLNMEAQMIHMGGCRDGGSSIGWPDGGEFTLNFIEEWNTGNVVGYKPFFARVYDRITTSQKPSYNEYGTVTKDFRESRMFSAGLIAESAAG